MTMWKPNLSLRIAGLLILLIIFVIVSSIASAALDSWTSYEDQNLGLAMDVPKAWVISPADEITETRTSATVIATHDNGDPAQGYPPAWQKIVISLLRVERSEGTALADFLQLSDFEEIEIAGTEALTTRDEREGITAQRYFLPRGRKVYQLVHYYKEPDSDSSWLRMLDSLELIEVTFPVFPTSSIAQASYIPDWRDVSKAQPPEEMNEAYRLPLIGQYPITQGEHEEKALDFGYWHDGGNPPVFASAAGYVREAQCVDVWWGCFVTVSHLIVSHEYVSAYAHMSTLLVSPGEYVEKGQLLGLGGSTGNSQGPHLHFGVCDAADSDCAAHALDFADVTITGIEGIDLAGRMVDGPGVALFNSAGMNDTGQVFTNDRSELSDTAIGSDAATFARLGRDWTTILYKNSDFDVNAYYGIEADSQHSYQDVDLSLQTFTDNSPVSENASSIKVGVNICINPGRGPGFPNLDECYPINPTLTPTPGGPPDPTGTPVPSPTTSSGNCPSDGSQGIYFYRDTNYQGVCYFSTDDVPDFGNTILGDNALSSIRFIGDWEVRIHKDTNYQGPYDVEGNDNPNLDINSLGGQYSSAKITDTTETCPTDGRAGVYMYSNRDYEGRCLFSTVDVPDFGDTNLGDNDLSSIRFIGDWEATIYRDDNFEGPYDVEGSDNPNLDINSLGGQYSSVEIESVIVPPTDTPTPTITPAPESHTLLSPTLNNGGFESGKSDWNETVTFVLDTENPHSGQYYLKGTEAEEGYIYRTFSLATYQQEIDEGRASTYFTAWVDAGNSELYRFILKLRDGQGNILLETPGDWHLITGSYHQATVSVPEIPVGVRDILFEGHVKRTAGGFTDVDFDDFTLVLQIGAPIPPTATPTSTPTSTSIPTATGTATSIPHCGSFSNTNAVFFDATLCNPSQGSIPLTASKTNLNLSDLGWDDRASSLFVPDGWSILAFEHASNQGASRCITGSMWDLSLDYFDNSAVLMDDEISSLIVYDSPGCPPFETSLLVLDDAPRTGETAQALFQIKNIGSRAIDLAGVLVGVHGPGCTDWGCPNVVDFPIHEDVHLNPGQFYTYYAERSFNVADNQYLIQALSYDIDGTWYGHSEVESFSVRDGIQVVQPIAFQPANPQVGELVTAYYAIKNVSDAPITVESVGMVARGPNCSDWLCEDGWADFPRVSNITLQPGQMYNYVGQRSFDEAGPGYFADAAYADDNPWWYIVPSNQRYYFTVGGAGSYLYLPIVSDQP